MEVRKILQYRTKWIIVVEDFKGVRFVISKGLAKMFSTKKDANMYAAGRLNCWSVIPVKETDYWYAGGAKTKFWMAT